MRGRDFNHAPACSPVRQECGSAPGGSRTHNTLGLSQLPLPVGPQEQTAPGAEYLGWGSNPQHTGFEPASSASWDTEASSCQAPVCSTSSAQGGSRTRNTLVLSQRPLPLGYLGVSHHEWWFEWMARESNPQGPKAPGLQPGPLPITVYPSDRPSSRARTRDLDDAQSGVRTHNIPILSRHPLPVGIPGRCGHLTVAWTGEDSNLQGHKTTDLQSATLPITLYLSSALAKHGEQYPGWDSNPQRTDP